MQVGMVIFEMVKNLTMLLNILILTKSEWFKEYSDDDESVFYVTTGFHRVNR
jgi:hypothetical protein